MHGLSVLTSVAARQQTETTIPADILLVNGTCIVNEAMLSGESTPLLKESIQLLDGAENLEVDGAHKGAVLFSGTKVLQAGIGGQLSSVVRLWYYSLPYALLSIHGHINSVA